MSVPETELPQAATAAAGLRRNLKLWQVAAVSIGVMAPSLAISLEPLQPGNTEEKQHGHPGTPAR